MNLESLNSNFTPSLENVTDKEGVLCLLTDKVDSPVIEAAKSLKVIATMSVGFDHLGKYIHYVEHFIIIIAPICLQMLRVSRVAT